MKRYKEHALLGVLGIIHKVSVNQANLTGIMLALIISFK